MFGLSSPDKIQRAGQTLGEVRRKELSHILNVERQLHELRRGHASLDPSGKIIRSAEIRDIREVKFASIIENSGEVEVEQQALPDIAKMMDNAVEVNRYDALERLLRLQKLVLLTERIILGLELSEIDKGALDRRWLNRWKLNAGESSNGALQQLWARILVRELINPGTTSLRALEHLSCFSLEDAEGLTKLGSWVCGDFIYRSALQALPREFDMDLFERLEEQNILRGVHGKVLSKTLLSQSESHFMHELVLADRLVRIESSQPRPELHVPAYMITRVGRELISLVSVSADSAYLEAMVQDLHARGMSVSIGQQRTNSSHTNII
ncbi:MAG: hypothetical protein CMK89_01530 [Pseudomonadales bacterium]|nr:hypothetical protein [Pseudomonadales bacterium]RLU02846.1 MAG: DUF2806 domain-containing protein [Ketobacter sp.]